MTTEDGAPMENLEYTWGAVSGRSHQDAIALGYRGPAGIGFRPEAGDSWLIHLDGGQLTSRLQVGGWFTGLWWSPSGRAFVTHAPGKIHQADDVRGPWIAHDVPGMMVGVWGLDDAHVYAWGLRGGRSFLLRFDGQRWADMPAPGPERIVAMGGSREDHLVAVGEGGLLARWDGSRWARAPEGGTEPLVTVHVDASDEVWVGGGRGTLIQGSPYGFSAVTRASAPISGVARWREEVWVATLGPPGLCKLQGTDLDSLKPNLPGLHLAPSETHLLFSNTADVGSTADGVGFRAQGVDALERITAPFAPMW